MRISIVVVAAALACAVLPAPAQDQPQVQQAPKDQAKPPDQGQTQVQPQIQPESVPKTQTKSQDRVQDQSAPAEANAPTKQQGRFSFNRVDNNYLRLDRETGQVAFCSPHAAGWACEAVPEERAALEKEIARLQEEVAALKTEVASLRPPPHPVPPQTVPPTPRADKDVDSSIKLPTAEDIARARAFIESAWRRLVEMLANIQKDMMQKT